MSQESIYKGPLNGFRGFSIHRDERLTNLRTSQNHILPLIESTDLPPATLPGVGGAIAFDVVTKSPYYSDGSGWRQMGFGAVDSYSFIKDGNQTISTSTETTIVAWDDTYDTYHTLPGWDMTTGIYTASRAETLSLEVNVAWSAGVSNLGDRSVRVQHMKLGIPSWTTIKEVITQADPDVDVETTQECQIHAKLAQGDAIRVVVEHDAPIDITIAGGNHSSISGFRFDD